MSCSSFCSSTRRNWNTLSCAAKPSSTVTALYHCSRSRPALTSMLLGRHRLNADLEGIGVRLELGILGAGDVGGLLVGRLPLVQVWSRSLSRSLNSRTDSRFSCSSFLMRRRAASVSSLALAVAPSTSAMRACMAARWSSSAAVGPGGALRQPVLLAHQSGADVKQQTPVDGVAEGVGLETRRVAAGEERAPVLGLDVP